MAGRRRLSAADLCRRCEPEQLGAELTTDRGTIYRHIVASLGGLVRIVKRALRSFAKARGQEAASAVAFYSIFTLFPLLLTLVAVGGMLLESEEAHQVVVDAVTRALPTSASLVEENLQDLRQRRGTVGPLGLIGLLWSATGAFTTVARNVSRAWPDAKPRQSLHRRLIALAMVGTLAGLLALSLLASTLLSLLPALDGVLWGGASGAGTLAWSLLSKLAPWLLAFLLFMGLYRWVPSAQVRWSSALLGALFAASAWEVAKRGFAWYLSSGLVRYELVYGSLASVVALMLWIYVSSWIALFGAHLGAAVAVRDERDADRPT
ncbi:MAG: YihY/virulence factor BrkB family protein [Anaerolineae bacterium]|nr:YihY/virulence factor BrkB family protein [Anaerolineae bacterium]